MRKILIASLTLLGSSAFSSNDFFDTKPIEFNTPADIAEALSFMNQDPCFIGSLKYNAKEISEMRKQSMRLVKIESKATIVMPTYGVYYSVPGLQIKFIYEDPNHKQVFLSNACSLSHIKNVTRDYFDSQNPAQIPSKPEDLIQQEYWWYVEGLAKKIVVYKMAELHNYNNYTKDELNYFLITVSQLEKLNGKPFTDSIAAANFILEVSNSSTVVQNDLLIREIREFLSYHTTDNADDRIIMDYKILRKVVRDLKKDPKYLNYSTKQIVDELVIQYALRK